MCKCQEQQIVFGPSFQRRRGIPGRSNSWSSFQQGSTARGWNLWAKKGACSQKKEPVDSSWKWQSPRFEPHSPQNSLLLFIVRMAIVKWIYFSKIATFWWWNRFKVTRSCIFIDGKENCEVPFVPKRLFSCIFQTLFTFPRPWLNAEVETFWFIIFFWQLSGPFACWGVQHILASHFIARAHFRDVQAWRDFRGRSQHLNANDQ